MTGGETGLQTLIDHKQVPETPHFPPIEAWGDLLGAIETLRLDDHPHRTLVIDTLNGAEALCHQYVCHRDFDDDWGPHGFTSYQSGFYASLPEWTRLLVDLDKLRVERKMTILWLCHTKIKPFKNPAGPDYDRYQADCHEKTWGLSHKWADCVLFGNFETTVTAVQENKKTGASKGKGVGGNYRIMYTERHAAYDAKNRLGLPSEIEMGNSPEEAWGNFISAVKAGREVAA